MDAYQDDGVVFSVGEASDEYDEFIDFFGTFRG